jgi:hypothetical protein
VRVLDSLGTQVHDDNEPEYLSFKRRAGARRSARDESVVRRALRGIDEVYLFAAAVGVGQAASPLSRRDFLIGALVSKHRNSRSNAKRAASSRSLRTAAKAWSGKKLFTWDFRRWIPGVLP